jgi:predicted permease
MTADRLYRILLHAYPSEFRDEYGAELVQLFRDRRRDTGTLATCALAFADLLKTAPAEHLDILWRDLRSAVRNLRAHPGFALVVILSLALGLGANTAIFSLLHATLFNQLPVRDPERLVSIGRGGLGDAPPFSYLDSEDLRARTNSFADVFIHSDLYTVKLGRGAQVEETSCEFVSPNYFATLGLAPARGRAFVPEDARAPVVIISDGLWKRHFNSDPDILGRVIRINRADLTVIGVAPESFHGVLIPWNTTAWIPIRLMPALIPEDAGVLSDRLADCCGVIARLNPGASRQQAEAELAVIAPQLAQADASNSRREPGWEELHLSSMQGVVPKFIRGRIATLLGFLMAVTTLVLLIACANVANLLLARIAARRGEIAIRLAVGARRGRLIRQLLTESALLTGIATAATLFLAVYGPRAIASLSPYFIDARVNLPVLAFSAVAALVTTIAFGLAPALEASRTDLVLTLKENRSLGGGGARRFGLREALAAVQVAASFTLLIAAGLFLRSLAGVQAIDPGFDTTHTFFVRMDLAEQRWNPAQQDAFLDDLRRRVENIGGVRSETFASHIPLELTASRSAPFEINSQSGDLWTDAVAPRYFETLAIPLIAGRAIDDRDRANASPVAVINATFARRYWHGRNPVGSQLHVGGVIRTVVGVVANVKHRFAGEDPSSIAYLPLAQALAQAPTPDLRLIVNVTGDPLKAIAPVLAQIAQDIPVMRIRSMSTHVAESFGPQRGTAELAGFFGILALALACMGIYGVIAHSVSRRTHEVGIRMAMGARGRDVVRMIVGQSLILAVVGIVAGSALALGVARLLKGSLYGVGAADPVTFVSVGMVWLAVAALAAWLPARRAARVDPLVALRCE